MPASLAAELADVLAQAMPDAPRLGLRARKKAAAMRRIQEVAVEQFEEHGFDAVTIEHIAEHAEVSPSSVYRYFGTKERLILHDEYDDLVFAAAERILRRYDPWTGFATALSLVQGTHFASDPLALRRVRIWFDTPAVRKEAYVVLAETAAALAPLMAAADRYGRTEADYRMVSASMIGAFSVAIEQWYAEGGTSDIASVAAQALELVRPAWATPLPPSP